MVDLIFEAGKYSESFYLVAINVTNCIKNDNVLNETFRGNLGQEIIFLWFKSLGKFNFSLNFFICVILNRLFIQ